MANNREVVAGSSINLIINIVGQNNQPSNADSTPTISITDAQSTVVRAASATGVTNPQLGKYQLTYTIPSTAPTGVWTDNWATVVNGYTVTASLSFVVLSAQAYFQIQQYSLGQDPNITYTNAEIYGINVLMEILKARLKNNNSAETTDAFGNKTFTDCLIFTDDELLQFLVASLSEFNQTPHRTAFAFSDQIIYETHAHVITEGAYILAVAGQMLIEAGREFTITDNGISMQPPPLSSTLNNQLSTFITRHTDMLKYIKTSMKPAPKGVGTFRVLAVAPAYLRLRHLRQRKIV